MTRTFKIFFIVLGLGIFILPKQVVFAQSSIECCDENSTKEECCKNQKPTSCHSEKSKDNSPQNNCGDDCTQCHSCTVHFVMNFLSSEAGFSLTPHLFVKKINFNYRSTYFSSEIQNIWQPPKIG